MAESHTISFLALALSLGYIFFMLYMMRHPGPKKNSLSFFPKVTVLVAFRDEEKNLPECCDALLQLDYPSEKLEILFLDDQSNDSSAKIVAKYITGKKLFKLIKIAVEIENLSGKMNALALGLERASGDYIFVTDADCMPHPDWIKTLLAYFDDSTAMVSGFTVLETPHHEKTKIFDELQIADWIFLQGLAYASSNIKRPITVIGNNLAFRKNVYDSLGGFKTIGFSLTEDHALMKAILDNTNYQVKYIRDPLGLVYSYPVKGVNLFYQQRSRWIKGGLKGRPFAYAVVGFSFLANLSVLMLFALRQWNMIAATAIGLIVGIHYFIYRKNLQAIRLQNLKKYFLKYELFYLVYSVILFAVFPFFQKITWKGRSYK